jgi:hypothetical protein
MRWGIEPRTEVLGFATLEEVSKLRVGGRIEVRLKTNTGEESGVCIVAREGSEVTLQFIVRYGARTVTLTTSESRSFEENVEHLLDAEGRFL